METHILDYSQPNRIAQSFSVLNCADIDWCINTVGDLGKIGPDSILNYSNYEQNLAINLFSAIEITRYFSKQFERVKSGKIIHFSGGGSSNSRPYFSPYSISKTALARYVENTALELASKNIQVYLISPGLMPSKMLKDSLMHPEFFSIEEFKKIESVCAEVDYNGQKITDLLDFLLSKNGNFCTGRMISAQWDNWLEWTSHSEEIESSDLYTLRRISGRDRSKSWGDL